MRMKNRRLALPALLFALGLLVVTLPVLLTRGRDLDTPTERPGSQAMTAADALLAPEREGAPSDAIDRAPSGTGDTASEPTETDARAASPLGDQAAASTGEPHFTIGGYVLADTGYPISGAEVEILPWEELVFERQGVALLSELRRDSESPHGAAAARARSGADGRFDVALESPGEYLVEVSAAGFARASEAPVRVDRREPQCELTFTLGAGLAIEGRVRDPRGSGISGAAVQLLERVPGGGRDYRTLRTTTAGDGAFSFAGLDARSYVLMAYPPAACAVVLPAVVPPAEGLELIAARGRSIDGQVVDATTGEPVSDALVTGLNPSCFGQATSDGGGRFRLELSGDDADIAIRHPDYVLWLERIRLTGGGAPPEVSAALEPGERVYGRVVRGGGEAIGGATVAMLQEAAFLSELPVSATDESGAFDVGPSDPAQPMLLLPRVPGLVPRDGLRFRDAGARDHEIAMVPAARLEGTLLGPNGSPISDASLRLRFDGHDRRLRKAQRWLRGDAEVWSDADGRFVFEDVIPLAGYALEIRHPDAAECRHAFAEFPPAPVEILLADSATLEGRIFAAGGSPPRAAVLLLDWPGSTPVVRRADNGLLEGGRRVLSASDGSYSIGNLPAGAVTLHVQAPPYVTESVALELRAGERNRRDIELRAGHTLKVVLLDGEERPCPAVEVRLHGLDTDAARRVRTGSGGEAVFIALPPDGYVVEAGGFAPDTIDLASRTAGTSTLRLVGSPP